MWVRQFQVPKHTQVLSSKRNEDCIKNYGKTIQFCKKYIAWRKVAGDTAAGKMLQYENHFEFVIKLFILTLSSSMLTLLKILKENIPFFVCLD